MKVILKQNVENLGVMGDVVSVKAGYGRNWLIPQNLAAVASPGNLRHIEELKSQAALKLSKIKVEAEVLAGKLAQTVVEIKTRVGEEGKLFGSITNAQIADALIHKGFEIDRRKITVGEIKALGEYTAAVKIHPEVAAEVKINVIAE